MWPFRTKRAKTLAGLSISSPVEILATVVSADEVSSPLSPLRAALIRIEVIESMQVAGREENVQAVARGGDLSHFDGELSLGSVVLGGALVLRTDDAFEVRMSARETRVVFDARAPPREALLAGSVAASGVPELDTLLRTASGGNLRYRERGLVHGARVRLTAVVQPVSTVLSTAYRSVAASSFVVRHEIGPATIEEIVT